MIKKAEFTISVADSDKLPDFSAPQIAVAGKSNVGKSSFINFITNNGKLARVAQTPGRTRLLNFFCINGGEYYLVDLPGYGFAKVSKEEKAKWGKMIEGYFQKSTALRHVFLLVDIRIDPTNDDMTLINYLVHFNIGFTIVATKCDKLSRMQTLKRAKEIAGRIGVGVDNVLLVSSQTKTGGEQVFARIDQVLGN